MASLIKIRALLAVLVLACAATGVGGRIVSRARNEPLVGTNLLAPHWGVEIGDLLRARGYSARDYRVASDDGHILALTRAWNPRSLGSSTQGGGAGEGAPAEKDPLLFVHGLVSNANEFLVSCSASKPENLSRIDLGQLSLAQAYKTLGGEPSADCLPTLAMDFGHEVWFLHRRGTRYSRQQLVRVQEPRKRLASWQTKLKRARLYARRVFARQIKLEDKDLENKLRDNLLRNKKFKVRNKFAELVRIQVEERGSLGGSLAAAGGSIRSFLHGPMESGDFWNYSLDEQAAFDVPNAVDFVRIKTGSDTVALVGHSSGGALALMAHALSPGLAGKLSKTIVWSPSFVLSHGTRVESSTPPKLSPSYWARNSPLTPSTTTRALTRFLCSLEIKQQTICETLSEDSRAMHNQNLELYIPVSARESAQLVQFARRGEPKLFDYGVAKRNLAAYNQVEPPSYDLGNIVSDKISIWSTTGKHSAVSFEDVEHLSSKLRVPHKLYLVDRKGALASEGGSFTYQPDVARVAAIPCLLDIVTAKKPDEEDPTPISFN